MPLLRERTAIYLGVPDSSIREECRKEFAGLKQDYRVKVIFVQDLVSELPQDLLAYMFPGLKGQLSADAIIERLRSIAGVSGNGFLIKVTGKSVFMPVRYTYHIGIVAASFRNALDYYPVVHTPKSQQNAQQLDEGDHVQFSKRLIEPDIYSDALYKEETDEDTVEDDIESSPNLKAKMFLSSWKAISRKYGFTYEQLGRLIEYEKNRIHLKISPAGEISLVDLNNKPTVKLDTQTKALYLLFLNHPEGIRLKELSNYKDELLDIYLKLSNRDNLPTLQKTIENLVDPFSEKMYVPLSRIKTAFINIMGPQAAQDYYVSGKKGSTYRIALDRSLVLFDK